MARNNAEETGHVYSPTFFNYIDEGARTSAQQVLPLLQGWFPIGSVADFGCGRGVWLAEWKAMGVEDVLGIDGDYVDTGTLAIPPARFRPADLTEPVHLDRRFSLAQCLEVGEHLPASAAATLVASLTRASDIVLFSAAVPGQGGEHHINEQPPSYWQRLFQQQGYAALDSLRPQLASARDVMPWYRYNAVLYANAAGQALLPDQVLATRALDDQPLSDAGNLGWKVRRLVVSALPRQTVTWIARTKAALSKAK